MSELTLFVFRIAFLIALWVFVFFVVYAVRSDLFGQRVRRMNAGPSKPAAPSPAASAFLTQAHATLPPAPAPAESPLSLYLTSGPLAGEKIALDGDVMTIGRASDSRLVIRDDYTSTRHASIERRNGSWFLRDLDSTNGTFVAGTKITGAVPLPLNTTISVGQTDFEVRIDS